MVNPDGTPVVPATPGTAPDSGQERLIEVNGKMVTEEELKLGYMRTEDYTRKTQELAAQKPKDEPKKGDEPNDDEQLKNRMRANGVAFQEDIQAAQAKLQQDQRFNELIELNPQLRPYVAAIKSISETNKIAPEDVIQQFGFADADKLVKAKDRAIMGDAGVDTRPKNAFSLTSEEWAQRTAQQRSGGGFTKAQSF